MLTVMHMKADSSRIYEAQSVEQFPKGRVFHKGTKAERTQPPSVFIIDPEPKDGSGIHLYEGTVYVMNSSGKTVATFEIHTDPPAKEVKAYLRVDEPLPQS
jgi:hypothetical protein